jgi:hypothetical protein
VILWSTALWEQLKTGTVGTGVTHRGKDEEDSASLLQSMEHTLAQERESSLSIHLPLNEL